MTELEQATDRTITRQLSEDESRHKPTYLAIEELPVKTIWPALPRRTNPWTDAWTNAMCCDILRHWEHVGFVLIYNKEMYIDVIQEQYHIPISKAESLVEGTLKEGMFREQDGWLIPEKPMLSLATDRKVTPGTSWICYTKTYYDIGISFE